MRVLYAFAVAIEIVDMASSLFDGTTPGNLQSKTAEQ